MTLANLAYKNLKGNFHKYVMYYLSNTLVVMVFFIFANFIFNPTVSEINDMGTKGTLAKNALILCEFVIIVFSILFTSYSNSNFLKSREKEFGLLSMFGMTKSQVRKYVIYENMIVSLVSIATGLGFGILFSKLFFMAISAIMGLNLEIPFVISIEALLITIGSFIILFQGVNYISSFKIKNNNIIELLKGARVPKTVPEFSKIKASLSILLIGLGYGMAAFTPGLAILVTMIPIVIVTVAGTYFLFTQFSILITQKLKKNNRLFYSGVNMISLSQIIYKLRDNAKVLFIVSVLGAVALTAAGTVYSLQQSMALNIIKEYPHDVSIWEKGLHSHEVIEKGEVEKVAEKNGQEILYKNEIVLLDAVVEGNEDSSYNGFYIISNSDFNHLAKEQGKDHITLDNKEAIIYNWSANARLYKAKDKTSKNPLRVEINGTTESYDIVKEIAGSIININLKSLNQVMVVSDTEFSRLNEGVSANDKVVYYSYNFKDWKRSVDTVEEINKSLKKDPGEGFFKERVTGYSGLMEQTTLLLFIGAFVAILFFIATGSIIYFKMFNDIQKDRQEFISLKKIGMTDEEMKKIINIQTLIIFFLPFVVATIHAVFAIKALSNLLMQNLYLYLLIIVAVYFILQLSYYIFAKTMYARQVKYFN